jgi:hypothetical protein
MNSRFTLSLLSLVAVAACGSMAGAQTRALITTKIDSGWKYQEEGTPSSQPALVPGTCRPSGSVGPISGVYTRACKIPANYAGRQLWVEFEGISGAAEISAGPDTGHLHVVGSTYSGFAPVAVNITGLIKPGGSGILQLNMHADAGVGLPGLIRPVHLAAATSDVTSVQEVSVLQGAGAARTVRPAALAINLGSTERRVTLHAAFSGSSQYSRVPDMTVALKPGEAKWVLFDPVKWISPSNTDWKPNLPYSAAYRASLHAITVSAGSSSLTRSFGFSAVKATPQGIRVGGATVPVCMDVLNETAFGQPVYARAAAFSPQEFPQLLREYQQAGVSGLCFTGTPATSAMLEACDRAGMLTVQAADYGTGMEAEEAVKAFACHPSVVMWHVNEATSHAASAAITAFATARCAVGFDGSTGGMQAATVQAGSSASVTGPVWIQTPPMKEFPEAPAHLLASIRLQRAASSSVIFIDALSQGAPGFIDSLASISQPRPASEEATQKSPRITGATRAALKLSLYGIAAFDLTEVRENMHSNGRGDWPTTIATQMGGTTQKRNVTVINDASSGSDLKLLVFPTQINSPTEVLPLPETSINLHAAPGSTIMVPVPISAPIVSRATPLNLQISVWKGGSLRFRETIPMVAMPKNGVMASVKYLGMDTQTSGDWVDTSGKRVYGQQAFFIAIRGGRTLYQDPDLYLRRVPVILPEDRFRGDVHDDAADAEIEFERKETTADPRVLWTAPDRLLKNPVAFYGVNGNLFFRADCADGAAHMLSLYILDFARPGVPFNIAIYDSQAHLLESRKLDGKALDQGAYVRFEIKGSVYISLESLSKYYPAVSGLFLDPLPVEHK